MPFCKMSHCRDRGERHPWGVATKNLELPRGRLFRGGERTQGEGCWGQERVRKAKQPRIKRGDQLFLPFPTQY